MEKGRFAPSPSGRMHLGNVFSFLLAWLDARSVGGRMVLRMEDLDPDRTGEPWTGLIVDDLKWLGLDWDEGYGAAGPDGPYSQRERTALYDEAFRALDAQGVVYPCWCSRAQRLAASAPHLGEERDENCHCPCYTLTEAERAAQTLTKAPAWKAAVPGRTVCFHDLVQGPQSFDLALDCGDFILRRADGVYGYQLAVTVDDALMGVTRVVRGRDLLDSAARQLWLMELLGYPAPIYGHVPLLLAEDGRRLSKREKDLDMGALREKYVSGELLAYFVHLAGNKRIEGSWNRQETVGNFSLDWIAKNDICVTF